MKTLTGSEKQVKWANEIRESVMTALEHASDEFCVNTNREPINIIKKEQIKEWLENIEKASTWIENGAELNMHGYNSQLLAMPKEEFMFYAAQSITYNDKQIIRLIRDLKKQGIITY